MFSYQVYKLVHFLGLFLLFSSLGGLSLHVMNGGDKGSNKARKLLAATHGTSLLLILVGGFGMLARLELPGGLPPWIHVKLTIWLLLGALLALPYRVPAASKAVWFGAPLLGLLSAYVALYKPF
jgi:hypothetical protein